jgi:predicted CxxxxCH...CXXCH cytochrome family protein
MPRAASAQAISAPGAPAHALYAANGFTCEACHPCGTRSPDGHGAAWMVQSGPGFHAASANGGLASCQGCHGGNLDGVGATAAVSCAQCHGPAWKTDCTMCHGGTDGTTGAPPKATWGNTADAVRVGAHAAHVAATHALSLPVGCGACHPVPADALSAGHLDGGTATVTFTGLAAQLVPAPGPAWSRAQATCTSTYCHGATLAGGTTNAPSWTIADGSPRACGACHGAPPPKPHVGNADCGSCHLGYTATAVNQALHIDGKVDVRADIGCTTCHGSGVNAAPPLGTAGELSTTHRAVGAHQAHLAGGAIRGPIACTECHLLPTANDHADGPAQLAWGPLASARGAAPGFDQTALTCANYCHGQTLAAGGIVTTPLWTKVDGTQAACGTCHGAPPPPPHPTNPTCELCHEGYTAASVNLATHVDGKRDVKNLTCSSCHGSAQNDAPPMGTRGETDTSSRAVGAHQQHLAGGPLRGPMACADCHLVPTAMDHTDGSVQLPFGPLAWTDGATPSWDPQTLTCSGTYCHGAQLRGGGTNQAPRWTGGPAETTCGTCHLTPPPAPHPHTQVCDNCHSGYTLTSVNLATHLNGVVEAEDMTCSSCHGDNSRVLTMQADPNAIAAPPFGSRGETETTSRSVGQHQAHVNRGDGIALPNKCRYCHAVPLPGAFAHANGVSEVTFGSLATMDGATPTFDEATNTCSSTYCHGSTLGRGGTDHSPSWTNPAPVGCTTCHGSPPPPPHPQDSDCIRCHPGYTATSVRKWTHVNGISDFPSGCNSCHDTPPNSGAHYEHLHERVACDRCHAGYTATSANPVLHRNARQDVTLSGWNPSQRTCSNIGCHGSEYWGRVGQAARQSCNQCHGVPPSSGEHYEHSEYACSRCHGAGYSRTTNNPATHMNGVADIPFAFYNRTTHTCSSTGCHGSEQWGTPRPVTPNCSNCHGFPPSLPHPQYGTCQSCHPSMQSTGVLTVDHNNGTLDISGAGCATCHGFPPTSTRAGGLHVSDPNCYGCHSTTVDATNQVTPNGTHNDGAVQVGGGGVGTYGCQSCHGDQARQVSAGADPNVKAAPPLGTRGETESTTRAVGAHLAHVSPAVGTLAGPAGCAECHVVPTSMGHAMGEVLMSFGPRASADGALPSWDSLNLTCASTYCHGSTLNAGGTNHLPSWTGGPGEAACGTCHGAPPPAPHPANASCGACHLGYTPTSVNLATHVDGVVQSSSHPAGYADAALHGRDANAQGLSACGSCHGADLSGGTVGVSCNACHTTAGFSTWVTDCTFCHGDRASGAQAPPLDVQGRTLTTNVSVGAHGAHAGATLSNPIACQQCHPARTASVVGDAAHVDGDGIAEVVFGSIATTGGAAATYTRASDTSASCAATYCHGAFGGGASATMAWTSTAQVGCTSCHGGPPPAPHPANSSCGACHSGYTATSVNRATHVDGVLQVTSNHPAGYADKTRHGYDANLQGLAGCKGCHGADLSGGSTGMSCNACHTSAGFSTWATNCTFCHGTAATGRQSPPVDLQGRSVTTNVSVGVHASHVGTTIANPVACAECHPARTASVVTDTAHMDGNGIAEVAFGTIARTGGAAATYTRASATSATCASTYCHGKFTGGANNGSGATMSWTSTTQVGCTSCHSGPPSTGQHTRSEHRSRSCGDCHGSGYTTSAVNKVTHLDGIEQVGNRITSYNRTTRSCSSSCHGSETW